MFLDIIFLSLFIFLFACILFLLNDINFLINTMKKNESQHQIIQADYLQRISLLESQINTYNLFYKKMAEKGMTLFLSKGPDE